MPKGEYRFYVGLIVTVRLTAAEQIGALKDGADQEVLAERKARRALNLMDFATRGVSIDPKRQSVQTAGEHASKAPTT